jgi:hypothetical protein
MGFVLAALVGLLVFAMTGPAHSANVTVSGTNVLKSLTLKNNGDVVVLKLVGPGAPCDPLRYIHAPINDRDGTEYTFQAGCYPGEAGWAFSLDNGGSLVDCPGLSLQRDPETKTYTARIPRDCMADLANTIRAGETWVQQGTRGGEAGPTGYVRRSCASDIPSC